MDSAFLWAVRSSPQLVFTPDSGKLPLTSVRTSGSVPWITNYKLQWLACSDYETLCSFVDFPLENRLRLFLFPSMMHVFIYDDGDNFIALYMHFLERQYIFIARERTKSKHLLIYLPLK